ncbi:MAG: hypothetical protein EA401_01630 [Planctomycetota bacterium]|nr:MAG: hypothetical protein EA401_01630 [Planctomycetota bacterium]
MGLKFIALGILSTVMVLAMSLYALPASECGGAASEACTAAACDTKKDGDTAASCGEAASADAANCDKAKEEDDGAGEEAAACAACAAS